MPDACVIALDLGATALKAGLVDQNGRPLLERRTATGAEHGPGAVLDRLLATIDDLQGAASDEGLAPVGIGVVVPGVVDETAGVAVRAANIGWREVPLRDLVEQRTAAPVAIGHDVRAGGLAEAALGAARGVRDFLFLPIGTGIAGAMVLDGRMHGGGGYAGEIGHLGVDPGGWPCRCGGHGCLETIASAAAIAARYEERTGHALGAAEVARRAAEGDPVAAAVWGEALEALASALAAYVTLLAPELIVVGGGLAQVGEQLLGPLRSALESRLSFQRRPRLVGAQLGDEAGRLGAALLAWRRAGRELAHGVGAGS